MPDGGTGAVGSPCVRPFRLRQGDRSVQASPVADALGRLLEHLLALRALERAYRGIEPGLDPGAFARRSLELLDIAVDCDTAARQRIPESGSLLVVANHPYGGIDGIALTALLSARRGDLRILANEMLCRIPEFAPVVLPLDVFGGSRAVHRNLGALRAARDWLDRGGAVLAFPAGEVSHLRPELGGIADPPWQRTAGWLLRQVPAARALAVHVDGANGATFQIAGLVHPRVRTALLPREILNKGGRRLRIRIGEPLQPGLASRFADDVSLTRFLRLQTYLLPAATPGAGTATCAAGVVPVAAPRSAGQVETAMERLRTGAPLARSGELVVVHVHGDHEPAVLEEIGRLREEAFRAVGEGTGRALDLDRFDAWYEHLVLWHERDRRIAGAYRVGCVGRILAERGRGGLYTSTLFDYGDLFLRLLGPAIEVGRSWVHADYQRSFSPLLLLWKAIGAWVLRHPGCHALFGAVSISGRYDPRAVQLAVEYLRRRHRDPLLAGLVRPRHPFHRAPGMRLLRHEIAQLVAPGDVDAVMTALGGDRQGLPVLVRQYLKLGGRMLGFNVDPEFGNALDCLVAVDLRRTDAGVLARYLGREAAARWLAGHASRRTTAGADPGNATSVLQGRRRRRSRADGPPERTDAIL